MDYGTAVGRYSFCSALFATLDSFSGLRLRQGQDAAGTRISRMVFIMSSSFLTNWNLRIGFILLAFTGMWFRAWGL
jgi:hypothetical protein